MGFMDKAKELASKAEQAINSLDAPTPNPAIVLKGGMLMVTPLRGADGEIYALAQGNLRSAEANLVQARERYIQVIGKAPVALEPPPPGNGLHFPPMRQGGWYLMAGFFLTISVLLWWVRTYRRARALKLARGQKKDEAVEVLEAEARTAGGVDHDRAAEAECIGIGANRFRLGGNGSREIGRAHV